MAEVRVAQSAYRPYGHTIRMPSSSIEDAKTKWARAFLENIYHGTHNSMLGIPIVIVFDNGNLLYKC